MKQHAEELIIVFKKIISEEKSRELVLSFGIPFREGMDSSRGKLYFYATGEKYILTFKNADEKMAFRMKRYQFLPEVHEIYEPDWNIQKD
jgi:hypothetical protein